MRSDELPPGVRVLACTRCGECERACPERLQPQELHRLLRTESIDALPSAGLFACTECGRCDPVCPSHIPLLEQFRFGKSEFRYRQRQRERAAAAKQRFEARNARLQRDLLERQARQVEHIATAASKDAVQAALERARAKRRQNSADAGD